MENWRNIKHFEGWYQVSFHGLVKSLDRVLFSKRKNKPELYHYKSRILKQFEDSSGYPSVILCKEGERKTVKVHRLVAEAFPEICGTPFPGAEVNHLDEDKTNNVATNLRFCSHTENINWGTAIERARKTNTNGKKSKAIVQYTLDGKLIARYPSASEAQRQTGFSQTRISICCRGKGKKAYGYKWYFLYQLVPLCTTKKYSC